MPRLDAQAENSFGLLISESSIIAWRASSETKGVATWPSCPIFLFALVLLPSSMPDNLRQKLIEDVLRFSFGSFLTAN